MNEFDQRMKQRAAQEKMQMEPDAESRMEQKLYAEPLPPRKKEMEVNIMTLYAIIGGVAAALIVMLAFLCQPKPDSTIGLLPSDLPVAQLIPVTQGKVDEQPVVSSDITFTGNVVQMTTWMENPVDDDIWLIEWEPTLEGAESQPARQLIWLEPGSIFSETYEWNTTGDAASVRCPFTAYRVTAHTLHWFEDETLLQDAFVAGALILEAGEWANGQAGEVTLLLPDLQQQEPLSYYIEKGMLTEELSADEVLQVVKEP